MYINKCCFLFHNHLLILERFYSDRVKSLETMVNVKALKTFSPILL